ncbi:unnamed protein product [Nippostrongylus brasiliensis]|uniref:Metalloendopeptidase n=1 Tax=Nippostrongylus brasiliensis TaxID=27835 RepID=A0A0N4YD15_NIPBR|nr:unnamed protein product [Nippostrongylus brasiliensis]
MPFLSPYLKAFLFLECFSYIGRQTSSFFRTREGNVETRMRLDPSCLRFNGRGTVMHELMHIIGFYHEHQRDDRDPRVRGDPRHYNYKIYPRSSTYYMGRYDPTSIMHYNFPGIVYPRSYFSVSDILRINTLYRCPAAQSVLSRFREVLLRLFVQHGTPIGRRSPPPPTGHRLHRPPKQS